MDGEKCTCSNWTFCRKLADCRYPGAAPSPLDMKHTAKRDCWCGPVMNYRDPVTLVEVWAHNHATQ